MEPMFRPRHTTLNEVHEEEASEPKEKYLDVVVVSQNLIFHVNENKSLFMLYLTIDVCVCVNINILYYYI